MLMAEIRETSLLGILQNVRADIDSNKHSANKAWEQEFLSQQQRWMTSEQPWVGSDKRPSSSKSGESRHGMPGERTVVVARQVIAFEWLRRLEVGSVRHTSLDNSQPQDELKAPLTVVSSPLMNRNTDSHLPAMTVRSVETSRQISGLDSFRTVVVGQPVKLASNDRKCDREYGGLAVYRKQGLYLWLRSNSPEFVSKLPKSLSMLGIQLKRWVLNGQLIKD